MRHPPVWGRGSLHILRLKYFLACGWRPHLKLPPSSCSPYMGRPLFGPPVHNLWRYFVVILVGATFSSSRRPSHKCHSSQLWWSHSLHFFGSFSTFIIFFLDFFFFYTFFPCLFSNCLQWMNFLILWQARKPWYFPFTNGTPSSHPVQNHFLRFFIWNPHNLRARLKIP